MGEVWIKEAEDLKASGSSGTMSGVGPPRAICHVTVSPSGGSWFDAMHRVLINKQAEPHLLYDPVTDRLGQYFPLNRSARALMNGGKDISHNKVGTACIQVEFVAQPDGFTRYWQPGPNFRAMMRAIGSWGIESQFIAPPAKSYSDNVRQSWSTYKAKGGWYGHCHVPSPETHWDPGPIDTAAFFAEAGVKPAPIPAPAPIAPQEDDLSDADVKAINDYTRALLLTGYTTGGADSKAMPSINDRLIGLEATVTAMSAAVATLANSVGINPELAATILREEVRAKLDGLKVTVATTEESA